MFGMAKRLEKHEPRQDVAISSRWRVGDRPLFMQASRGAVERFVGQLVGCQARLAREVRDEPPPHLDVGGSAGVNTFVEPAEKLVEGLRRRSPIFLEA